MYKVVRNAISKDLAGVCYDYLQLRREVAKVYFTTGYQHPDSVDWGHFTDPDYPGAYHYYSDVLLETLLTKVQPIIEKEMGLTLYPHYSFGRIYIKGNILERHKDRPACEISATLNLGGDPWPIFLGPSGKEGTTGVSVLLEPGDLLTYEGVKLEHWRERFEGENCTQVFFHYGNVLAEKAEEHKNDGRPFLGLPYYYQGFKLDDNYNRS
jgi:hypothetical protein